MVLTLKYQELIIAKIVRIFLNFWLYIDAYHHYLSKMLRDVGLIYIGLNVSTLKEEISFRPFLAYRGVAIMRLRGLVPVIVAIDWRAFQRAYP